MKIAITSQGKNLNAEVDPRFGRCSYLIVYDLEAGYFEPIENSNIQTAGGAGIQTAQMIAEKEVEAVLTGNVGPNAFTTLQAAKIEVYTGVSGKVSDVIEKFQKGNLEPNSMPSVESHHGMTAKLQKNNHKSKKVIAVASKNNEGLNAVVSAHFGRCPYYTLIYTKNNQIQKTESIANPFYEAHGQPGQVPGFIRDQGAQVIVAGGMGQRAVGFFNEYGIEAVTGAVGKVEAVIDAYLTGNLKGYEPCTQHE